MSYVISALGIAKKERCQGSCGSLIFRAETYLEIRKVNLQNNRGKVN